MKKWLLISISSLLLIGCAKKQEIQMFYQLDENRTIGAHEVIKIERLDNRRKTYRFRPFDRITMTFYGQPEYSTPKEGVLIDRRGYAALPIVGRVRVAGLSESYASKKIQRLIRKSIVDAIVVVENPDKKVYVIGDVNKPGPIKLVSGDIALIRAIGSAGGFRDTANKDVIYIVHKRGREARLERVSLSGVSALQDSFKYLVPGDIVYVAPNSIKMINMGPMQTLQIIGGAMAPFGAVKSVVQ
jgi:polysaccharide export outer membrane protein